MKFATLLVLASVSAIKVRDDDNIPKYSEQPAGDSDAFGGYERVIPDRFKEERDDRLMNSIFTKYAREVKSDGVATGRMFLNKDDA